MDPAEYNESSHSALLCIHSTSYVLAVWNFLDKKPFWKFPAESAEPGELLPDTIARGGLEEAGLTIPVVRDEIGMITKLGDESVVVKFVNVVWYRSHPRYFHRIRLSDRHLLSLSDKLLRADKDELLWTWALPFMHPFKMERFHTGHLKQFEDMINSRQDAA